tara:strand:- start:1102 stop:1323 length:222 start_codon:yes stop_codon:yes gene_type:complete
MDLKKIKENDISIDTQKLIKKENEVKFSFSDYLNILFNERRRYDEELIYPPHYMLYLSIVGSQKQEPRIVNMY